MRPSGRYKAVEPLEVKNSPQFKDLDSDLVSFRLSFHRDIKALFSNFTNSAEDHHLLLALAFAHVASMVRVWYLCSIALF